VSIFLTELSTRHTIITKQKTLSSKLRLHSSKKKLTEWLSAGSIDKPIQLSSEPNEGTKIRMEDENDENDLNDLGSIPFAESSNMTGTSSDARFRLHSPSDTMVQPQNIVLSDSEDDSLQFQQRAKRRYNENIQESQVPSYESTEDKKKYDFKTSYDGFSIYGRILCLVVKRKGSKSSGGIAPASSHQMLENWISTQANNDIYEDGDEHILS
jgi:hypothetical protein